jgi:hypothetical protein
VVKVVAAGVLIYRVQLFRPRLEQRTPVVVVVRVEVKAAL